MPGAPTGLNATAGLPTPPDGTTKVDLSWTAPTNTGGSAITGHRIERSANGTSGWTNLVANTGNTNTMYSDTGLASETTRHYRVSAINSSGEGSPSDTAEATTADIVAPMTTGAYVYQAKEQTATGPEIETHIALGFDEDLAGSSFPERNDFTVTADGVPFSGGTIRRFTTAGIAFFWALSKRPPVRRGQSVVIRYTAPAATDMNAIQDSSSNRTASFTTGEDGLPTVEVDRVIAIAMVPSEPTNVGTEATSSTAIRVTWHAPVDNGGRLITGYKVESCDTACDTATATWTTRVANSANKDTAYTDSTVPAAGTRWYRVSAINSVGTSAASDPVMGMGSPGPDTSPPELRSATVTAADQGRRINLAFNESINSSYFVLPSKNDFLVTADGVEVTIGTMDGFNLATGGQSLRLLSMKSISPAIRSGQSVVIQYTAPAASDPKALQDEAGNRTASFTTGQGAVPSVVNSSNVAPIAPGAPRDLEVEFQNSTTLELEWDAPADNGGRAITGYKIQSCDTGCEAATASWSDLEPNSASTNTSYTDSTVPTNGTRWYRVFAINSIGTGAASDATSGTAKPPVGTVSISTSTNAVREGQSVRWTVTATTLADTRPGAGTEIEVRVFTQDIAYQSTAGEDYHTVSQTVTFQQSHFQRQSVDGNQRWVATRTGVTQNDQRQEGGRH